MSQATAAMFAATPSIRRISPSASLETRLQAALEHARRLTEMVEPASIEVAIAWETVEELSVAHRRQPTPAPSAFARYCMLHPDAPECRIYED